MDDLIQNPLVSSFFELVKVLVILLSILFNSNNKAMKEECLTLSTSRFSKDSEKSETDPDPVSTGLFCLFL